jgi:ketosteroid isomerase-like protein
VSTPIQALVEELYAALAVGDETRLIGVLADDVSAHFCAGMPAGAGTAHGRQDAKTHWWAIGAAYAVRPEVEELVRCVDGRLLVRGIYRGVARIGGGRVEAVFTHLWRAEAGRLIELHQVTDTARWMPSSP